MIWASLYNHCFADQKYFDLLWSYGRFVVELNHEKCQLNRGSLQGQKIICKLIIGWGNDRSFFPFDALSYGFSSKSLPFQRFSSLTVPFIIPAWFLGVEDHPSVWVVSVMFYCGQNSEEATADILSTVMIWVIICVHRKESSSFQNEHCCLDNPHLRCAWKACKITCTGYGKPDSLKQALKIWWHGWHSPGLTLLSVGSYPGVYLFYRLAVQSNFTQQCRMKLQIWARGHRKGFAQSHDY